MKGAINFYIKVLYVLDKIQERSFFRKKNMPIELQFTEGSRLRKDGEPTASEQSDILEQLEEEQVIRICNKDHELRKINATVDKVPYFIIYNLVEVIQPNFDKYYESVSEKVKYSLEINSNPIEFDTKSCDLKIFNKSINLSYSKRPYLLCKMLFTNPKKRWENDELQDDYIKSDIDSEKRDYYFTCRNLNKKVYEKTGIKDLVVYDNKTFTLNPKYNYKKNGHKM